jgi:nucleoid DNA-binding protein
MLDVPVPEIILNQPGIRALVDEDIAVTARRVVTFKPGQKLKRTVCSQSNS